MATDVPPLKYEELAAARCVLKQRNNVVIRYPNKITENPRKNHKKSKTDVPPLKCEELATARCVLLNTNANTKCCFRGDFITFWECNCFLLTNSGTIYIKMAHLKNLL